MGLVALPNSAALCKISYYMTYLLNDYSHNEPQIVLFKICTEIRLARPSESDIYGAGRIMQIRLLRESRYVEVSALPG